MSSLLEAIRRQFSDVEFVREQMHPYQREAYDFLKKNPFSALFIDMGMGKSVTSLTLIRDLICDFEFEKVLVIGPIKVVTDTWPNEIRKWQHTAILNHSLIRCDDDDPELVRAMLAKRSYARSAGMSGVALTKYLQCERAKEKDRILSSRARHNASVHLINREQIEWLVNFYGPKWPYRTVVIDECFVSGTQVRCPGGQRAIEGIKEGELVETPYGARPVIKAIRKSAKLLTKITLSNGRVIVCTPSHRFFTEAGWMPARELLGEVLYGYANNSALHMPAMQRDVLDMEVSPEVLQSFVQDNEYMGDQARRDDSKHQGSCEDTLTGYLEQGFALVRGNQAETSRDRGTQARRVSKETRGQWHRDESSREDGVAVDCARLGVELRNSFRRAYSRLPNLLQGGLRMAREESRLGDRRGVSQFARTAGEGLQEGRDASIIRVVGLQDIECGRGEDVFDLSVEGAPYYFANDVLVHNCSAFKDHTTARFKALKKVRCTPGLIKRMHILTATPAAESYVHLFPQIFLLDRGQRLGKSIDRYRKSYFDYNQYSRKYKLREGCEEIILNKIKDICLVMKAEDYLDLEKPTVAPREVILTEPQMALYKSMQEEGFVRLPDGTEIDADTAAALSGKLLQMSSGVLYETFELGDWETEDVKKVRKVHHLHDHKIEMLKQIAEECPGEPLLVAYHFKSSLERLRKAFPKATAMDKEGKCIKDWNARKIPMLFIHPASGGHGLNMQKGGHNLVFFDLPWSLELYLQLIGRLARQGQKHPVLVQPLIAKGTLDEYVFKSLVLKQDCQEKLFRLLKRMIKKAKERQSQLLEETL